MSHTRANLLMLLASFIWGTAFVSQKTGMGAIGPFTFSFARFFFAFLTVLPLAIYFERHNIKKIFCNNKLLFLCCATGFALFVGIEDAIWDLAVSISGAIDLPVALQSCESGVDS